MAIDEKALRATQRHVWATFNGSYPGDGPVRDCIEFYEAARAQPGQLPTVESLALRLKLAWETEGVSMPGEPWMRGIEAGFISGAVAMREVVGQYARPWQADCSVRDLSDKPDRELEVTVRGRVFAVLPDVLDVLAEISDNGRCVVSTANIGNYCDLRKRELDAKLGRAQPGQRFEVTEEEWRAANDRNNHACLRTGADLRKYLNETLAQRPSPEQPRAWTPGDAAHVAFWGAVNAYAATWGDESYAGVDRQKAVVRVEGALAAMTTGWKANYESAELECERLNAQLDDAKEEITLISEKLFIAESKQALLAPVPSPERPRAWTRDQLDDICDAVDPARTLVRGRDQEERLRRILGPLAPVPAEKQSAELSASVLRHSRDEWKRRFEGQERELAEARSQLAAANQACEEARHDEKATEFGRQSALAECERLKAELVEARASLDLLTQDYAGAHADRTMLAAERDALQARHAALVEACALTEQAQNTLDAFRIGTPYYRGVLGYVDRIQSALMVDTLDSKLEMPRGAGAAALADVRAALKAEQPKPERVELEFHDNGDVSLRAAPQVTPMEEMRARVEKLESVAAGLGRWLLSRNIPDRDAIVDAVSPFQAPGQ